MHSNRLTGKFPASLLDLMDLSELRLSNNSFRYSAIPQQMQMLDTTPKCTFAPPPTPPPPHPTTPLLVAGKISVLGQ